VSCFPVTIARPENISQFLGEGRDQLQFLKISVDETLRQIISEQQGRKKTLTDVETGETRSFDVGTKEGRAEFDAAQEANKKALEDASAKRTKAEDEANNIAKEQKDFLKKQAEATDPMKKMAENANKPGSIYTNDVKNTKSVEKVSKDLNNFETDGPREEDKPSEELKAARQRAQELRAAELFLGTDDAQKGEFFEASAGGTNIDPTTGKPITRERAEEIRDRALKGRPRGEAFDLRDAVRVATNEKDRLEKEEAKSLIRQTNRPSGFGEFPGLGLGPTENQQSELDRLKEIRKESKDFKSFEQTVGTENAQKLLDAKKAESQQILKQKRDQQVVARLTDPRQVRNRRTGEVETIGQRNQRNLQNDIFDLNFRKQTQERNLKSKERAFQELGGEDALFGLLTDFGGQRTEKEQREFEALKAAQAARDSAKKRFDTTSKQLEAKRGQQALLGTPATPAGPPSQPPTLPPAAARQQASRDVATASPTGAPTRTTTGAATTTRDTTATTAGGGGGADIGSLTAAINTLTTSTFASDLLQAANKFSELGDIKVNFEGSIKPIKVILEPGNLFNEVREGVINEVKSIVAEEVQQAIRGDLNQ